MCYEELLTDLSAIEKSHLWGFMTAIHGLRKYKIKEDVYNIMSRILPEEEIDKEFCEKYAGKTVYCYRWEAFGEEAADYFVLEEDNNVLRAECLEEI